MKKRQEGAIAILPPKPGACKYCGDVHLPDEPHNRDSIIFQHHFRKSHGRYPTWYDAMRHCSPETREKAIKALSKRGIMVEEPANEGRSMDQQG